MNKSSLPNRQAIIFRLLIVAAAILITGTVVVYNNSFRSLPLYLFLLCAGISLMLALGMLRGGLAGLLIITLWIALKRATGVWETAGLPANIFELAMVMAVFGVCGWYNSALRRVLDAYYDSYERLELLDLEDRRVGLIKAGVGKLRLQEEEERSVRYKRPFSLLLAQVLPVGEQEPDAMEFAFLLRVAANTIKSTTRRTDIPFLAASDQIALILPETNLSGAKRVVNNIMQRMCEAHFMDDHGQQVSLNERVEIRYGFVAFSGISQEPIDMLPAAQRSLEKSLAGGMDPGFQNRPVVGTLIGEAQGEDGLDGQPYFTLN